MKRKFKDLAKNALQLSSFQLITRYCKIEAPYWGIFLEHYKSLGVSYFHIIVQTQEDLDDFKNRFSNLCPNYELHKLNSNLPPNKVMKQFNIKLLKPEFKYTIFLDSDEFFQVSGLNNDWINSLGKFSQMKIPWAMNILENIYDDNARGYFGHTGKPIARTVDIDSFRGDHAFVLKGFRTKVKSILGIYNNLSLNKIHAFLIHYWARGLGDVILRTLFSRFKSFKQADQSSFFSIVNSGSIPNRLKMMAYLSIQKDYLLFDTQIKSNFYNKDLEYELLKSFGLTEILIDDICNNYFNYKNKLLQNNLLPNYPSLEIPTMQSLKNVI